MAQKKKSKKNPIVNWFADNLVGLLILIALIIIIIGANSSWFNFSYTEINDETLIQKFESSVVDTECSITLNEDEYCDGDLVKATLEGIPGETFFIGLNVDSEGWTLWDEVVLDENGEYSQSGVINDVGNYKIRAVSENCLTNLVDVDVVECEDCWWQTIDSFNGDIEPYYKYEWKANLVPGDFKWVVDSESNMNYWLIKGMSSTNYFPNTADFEHEFNVMFSDDFGIQVENPHILKKNVDIELQQWVCEGDDLNWNPEMFDSPNEVWEGEVTDDDCHAYCEDNGYYGGWLPLDEDECDQQLGTYLDGCCCVEGLM